MDSDWLRGAIQTRVLFSFFLGGGGGGFATTGRLRLSQKRQYIIQELLCSHGFSLPQVYREAHFSLHRKKCFSIFPSPAGISLTKLSLGENNLKMTSLFPLRESLVSDILAGDGNIEKLFSRCINGKR
jgi:hypothetical protein